MRVTPDMIKDIQFWKSVVEKLPMPEHLRGTFNKFVFYLDNANRLTAIFGQIDEGAYQEAMKMKSMIDSSMKQFHQAKPTYH
jgi:hypothetical protein